MYNGAESYFENGVMSADPVELVRMLYRGGIEAVEKARQHLREGDIAARSGQITRAGAIIAHLTFSVNRDVDPAMGANLVELYDYMQRQLLRANLEQADRPLAEVGRLLSTLLEGFAACGPVEAGAAETTPAWAHAETEPVELPSAGVYGQPVSDGLYAETASAGMCGQTAGAGVYGQTVAAGAYGQTVDARAYGQTVDARVYAEAGQAGTAAGAGVYGQTVAAGAYAQAGQAGTAGAGPYAETGSAGAYGQTVDAGVYSPTVGGGAYASMTGAGAYAPTTGAGAYAQTGAAGGYGEEEQEVEYAGKSWNF